MRTDSTIHPVHEDYGKDVFSYVHANKSEQFLHQD